MVFQLNYTFARVFAMLAPQEFQECFLNWVQSISKITDGEIVAIDGKTLRHSYDRGGQKGAIKDGKCLGD